MCVFFSRLFLGLNVAREQLNIGKIFPADDLQLVNVLRTYFCPGRTNIAIKPKRVFFQIHSFAHKHSKYLLKYGKVKMKMHCNKIALATWNVCEIAAWILYVTSCEKQKIENRKYNMNMFDGVFSKCCTRAARQPRLAHVNDATMPFRPPKNCYASIKLSFNHKIIICIVRCIRYIFIQ